MKFQSKQLKAEAALLLTTLLWGATFALIKSALQFSSPMMFVTLRFSTAFLLLIPLVYKNFLINNSTHFRQAIILGLIYAVGFVTQTTGLLYTTATKSAFITGLFVIFTPMFQAILQKHTPSKINILATVLAAIGVLFLSSQNGSLFDVLLQVSNNFNFGDFLTLICALAYALYIVYLDMISKGMNYKFLTIMQVLITAIVSAVFLVLLDITGIQHIYFTPAFPLLAALGYTAVFATIITTMLQSKYQKGTSPARASIIFSLEPIFASICAFFILGERFTIFGFIGASCIFSGLIISEVFAKEA